jgi:hypothetical protein
MAAAVRSGVLVLAMPLLLPPLLPPIAELLPPQALAKGLFPCALEARGLCDALGGGKGTPASKSLCSSTALAA